MGLLSKARQSDQTGKEEISPLPQISARSPIPPGSKERADTLLNLIDLFQELSYIDIPAEFWKTLLHALLSHVGSRSAAIFFEDERKQTLELITQRGFQLERKAKIGIAHPLVREIMKNKSILFHDEIVLPGQHENQDWNLLSSLNVSAYIPVIQHQHVAGIVLIGKPVSESTFSRHSLLYMQLFGEVLGSFRKAIETMLFLSREREHLDTQLKLQTAFSDFLLRQSEATSEGAHIDSIKNFLEKNLGIQTYVILQNQFISFRALAYRGLSSQTAGRFEKPASSTFYRDMEKQPEWTKWQNIDHVDFFARTLNEEEKEFIEQAMLYPVYRHGELIALFILFDIPEENKEFTLSFLSTAFKTFALLIQSGFEKRHTQGTSLRTDPLLVLQSHIDKLEDKQKKSKTPWSLLHFQIDNLQRLEKIMGKEWTSETLGKIHEMLSNMAPDGLAITEFSPGNLAILLHNRGPSGTWAYVKKVQRAIQKEFPEEEIRPLFSTNSFSRPEQEIPNLNSFLSKHIS